MQTNKENSKIVVVTSGKGGVGKTTTSAALALGLARRGFKVVVIDFDIGLRNLDVVMGCERRVVYDIVNIIKGESNINQTLIKDKRSDNLFILAASQTQDKNALTDIGVKKILDDLKKNFDYIICDSPAGIETGALLAMKYADQAIVVTNPEVSSIRDADRVIGLLSSKTQKSIDNLNVKIRLLITRYNVTRVENGEMLSLKDIQEILSIELIGLIPESTIVLQASNAGIPVIDYNDSEVSLAYHDTVDRFLGYTRKLRFIKNKKLSIFKRFFMGK